MFLLRRKAEIVGTVMHERKSMGIRRRNHARTVECARVKTSFVGKREKSERGPDDANGLAIQKLYDDARHPAASSSATSDQCGAVDLGIGVRVQFDVFTQRNRCETGLHGR